MREITEYNGNNARKLNTGNGNINNNNKNNSNRVRAFLAYIMEYLIPLEDFFDAYFKCRKHKRKTANAAAFAVDYIENVVELWREVNERKYEIGTSICFIVKYPKLREVFAADFRDRIIHHLVISKLEKIFEDEFIDDTYSCRKGKGTLYGVKSLDKKIKTLTNDYTEDCWVGKFDIKSFFTSISKNILFQNLKSFIEEKYHEKDKPLILWLVEKIVLHSPQYKCVIRGGSYLWKVLEKEKSLFTCGDDNGIPIGNLSSQVFANFYLNWFDHMMTKLFSGNYGRYVDDFYVLAKTKEEIINAIGNIEEYLETNLNLELHKKKRYIQGYWQGIKFTGTVVKKGRFYIGNSTRGNMVRKIHRYNNMEDKELTVEKFTKTLNSYLGFMKHSCTYSIKYKEIIEKVYPYWGEYIYATGGLNKIVIKSKYKNP